MEKHLTALQTILSTITGLEVIFAFQRQPRPKPPFISISTLSKKTHTTESRYSGLKTGTISCQIFQDRDGSIVDSIVGGLNSQDILDLMKTLGAAYSVKGDILHLGSALPDERDVMTLSFSSTWSTPEPDEGEIEFVETTGTFSEETT